jgi:hypothetical protein
MFPTEEYLGNRAPVLCPAGLSRVAAPTWRELKLHLAHLRYIRGEGGKITIQSAKMDCDNMKRVTDGLVSEMVVRLSVLLSGRALLSRDIIFSFWNSFLLDAERNPGPSAA